MNQEKILIVDDEPMALDTVREMVDREGYQATAVDNGMVALQTAQRENFDLLITDNKMPEISGLELVSEFREVSPETISILVTGYPNDLIVRAAIRQGIFDYLIKPLDRGELCAAIGNALDRKRLTDKKARLKQLVILSEVSQAVATVMEQRDVLQFMLSGGLHLTRSSGGVIMLFDTSVQGVMVAAALGRWENAVQALNAVLKRGIARYVAEVDKPILFTNVQQHPLFGQVYHGYPRYKVTNPGFKGQETILLPIETDQEMFGILNIYREDGAELLTETELELLTNLAGEIGMFLRKIEES